MTPHTEAPIPDGLVCLTFDDGVKSQHTVAAPLLEELGFGATFYISEYFLENQERYMTWPEAADLDARGFEIGNHTRRHADVTTQSEAELLADIAYIDDRCAAHAIAKPTTFCYPGYHHSAEAAQVVRGHGFDLARRGIAPEYPYHREGGRGAAYDPAHHDPLLIPSTGVAGPVYSFDDLKWSVDQAVDGAVCVFTLHGVPDLDHPWGHTPPETFERYMRYLQDRGCQVIALQDLVGYAAVRASVGGPGGR